MLQRFGTHKNSNPIFFICLGHHFPAHNFPPKLNRNHSSGHHANALQTATCLNFSLSVGDPDLTAVMLHQNYAPPGNGSNGNCQQSGLRVLQVGLVCLKDMLDIFLWFSYCVSDFKFVEGQPVATSSPGWLSPLLQPTTVIVVTSHSVVHLPTPSCCVSITLERLSVHFSSDWH